MHRRRTQVWLVLILVLSFGLTACSGSYKNVMPTAPGYGNEQSPDSDKRGEDSTADRQVISTGNLSLTVEDLEVAEQEVRRILAELRGYMQQSYSSSISGSKYWEFTLRIPAEQFDKSITMFSALGKMRTIRTTEQDVTEEYMDLDARLRVLHREEERLLELLKMAVTMDDFLKVEASLSRVRVDIEQTTGRLRYLDNRIDFATLALTIQQEAGTVEPELRGFAGLGKRISNAFREGLNIFVDLIAGTMVFLARSLPILPIVALVFYGLFRLRKRVRRKG